MIIKTERLQEVASKVLASMDDNALALVTETLEIVTRGDSAYFNVTNKEYYISVKCELSAPEEFHACVNANLFLKLVNKTTSENITLTIDGTNLKFTGNGSYTLPLTTDPATGNLIELPTIDLNNVVVDIDINTETLNSIVKYNSKQLTRGIITNPVQRLYYMDELGCITATKGGVVNSFNLEAPVKVLFDDRLVKLFTLLKTPQVAFEVAYDTVEDSEIPQTKVAFTSNDIRITAILTCDDELLQQVKADAIRQRAVAPLTNNVSVDKNMLANALERLALFSAGYGDTKKTKTYCEIEFNTDGIVIWDSFGDQKKQKENLNYAGGTNVAEPYTALLALTDFKSIIDSFTDDTVSISFGDHRAFIFTKGQIKVILPETFIRG